MFTHPEFSITLAEQRRHDLYHDAASIRLARAVRRVRRRPVAPSTASPPDVIDLRVRTAAPPVVERSHHPAA
jgi:hypothetical protein